MNDPASRNEASGEVKKQPVPWLLFGVPIGCAIGIGIGNLALGVGAGMLLGATASYFHAKREGRKVSVVVQLALVVACAAILVLGLLSKK